MWQRFTERARKVVFYAQEEAGKWGENFVGPEHLLLGLIHEEDNMAGRVLNRLGISLQAIREGVEAQLQPSEDGLGQDLQLTPAAKRIIDFADEEAKHLQNNYVGAEHLLLGILREPKGIAQDVLMSLGITVYAARDAVRQLQAEGDTGTAEGMPPEGMIQDVASYMKAAFSTEPGKPAEELLSLDEAVKFLGTSKPTLYRLLGQDEIKGLKVGRQWRFRKADLVTYMERGPVAVAAAPKEDLDMELAFFAEQLGQEAASAAADAEAKTIRLADSILTLAIQTQASDIHLEPHAEDFLLRLRVDGVLHETRRLPVSIRESLTARYKMMAEMDLSEKRLPQDGRIPMRHEGKDFDLRVAAMPSLYGEAITMRILAKQDILVGLDFLGLAPEDLYQIRDMMHQPNGIVIATGPSGAGKTTLLYSCLQDTVSTESKVLTIEDPVELALPYATQIQVNKKIGLTFPALLRSSMRQDPDLILVGEMQEGETAQVAVEAALNGHLLLTTLQTGDAPSALLRLLDIGIEPHLISATVVGVVASRLARRVCEDCKRPDDLSTDPAFGTITALAAEGGYEIPADAVFVRGAGCAQCRGRGYRGRIGLYEVLTLTEPLTGAILRRAPAEELREIAVENGMRTLLADGIRKAASGQTTVKEVLRAVSVSVS